MFAIACLLLKEKAALQNIFYSIGASVIASCLIFKLAKYRSILDESVGQAGVEFIGDRKAFGDFIGWSKWLEKTDRRSEVIIIGKEHKAWLEDAESKAALRKILEKSIKIQFIFQAAEIGIIDSYIENFTSELTKAQLNSYIDSKQLILHKYVNKDAEYGYYWNGKQLIVKFYFNFSEKRKSPFIVFDVKFSKGKFCIDDFTKYAEIINYSRTEMLVQAAHNMGDILEMCKEDKVMCKEDEVISIFKLQNRLIASHHSGVAAISLGAITEAHTVVFSKENIQCLQDMPSLNARSYIHWVEEIKNKLVSKYGNVLIFEHGSKCINDHISCSVNWLHLHIVPISINVDVFREIEKCGYTKIIDFKRFLDIHDVLSTIDNTQPYFWVFHNNKGVVFSYKNNRESQLLRKILFKLLNREDSWNWRENPVEDFAINCASEINKSELVL